MWFRYFWKKMVELFANTGNPDETPHSSASDLGLHCLPIPFQVSPDYNGLHAQITIAAFILILIIIMYFHSIIWASTWQNLQKKACAPSKDSDLPGNPPSLIRVFPVGMKQAWVLSYPLSTQGRLLIWLEGCQADLSLCWGHMPFCWFCLIVLAYICSHTYFVK